MKVAVGRKNLFAEKTRLLMSVGGVAFSVLLFVMILGMYLGFDKMASAYINSVNTDLWVFQEGSSDMFQGSSVLSSHVEEQLKTWPEVKEVVPVLARQVGVQFKGKDTRLFLIGFDTERNLGGPIRMSEGASIPQKGQIIVDKVFARSQGVKIGDTLRVLSKDLKVVGISDDGGMLIFQFAFVALEDGQDLLNPAKLGTYVGSKGAIAWGVVKTHARTTGGFSNYFLVGLDNPKMKDTVAKRINTGIEGVKAESKESFASINRRLIADSFLPVLSIFLVIGFVVGVSVIGLTIYTATVEKTREYGILKAVGGTNWQLYKVVLEQSMIAGVLGYLLGLLLSVGGIYLSTYLVPQFVMMTNIPVLGGIFVLALLMSAVASYIPVQRIVKLDPASVFKS